MFKKEAKRKYGENHWYLRQFAITAIFIISANKYRKWLLCVLGGKLCTRHYFGKHGDVTANKMAAARVNISTYSADGGVRLVLLLDTREVVTVQHVTTTTSLVLS